MADSALQEEALTLASHADRVVIFLASESFSAQHVYQERVLAQPKIEVRYQTIIEEVVGANEVTGARARHVTTREKFQIDLSALFVMWAWAPNTGLLKDTLRLSETGHVPTDVWMRTERPGLYAVGDIRQESVRQAITSAGEGAVAAIAAQRYIKDSFS